MVMLRVAGTLLPMMLLPVVIAGAQAEAPPLWSIGGEGRTAAFALGPANFHGYTGGGFFIAGWSDAKHDWPYVHPGPADGWAGGRPQTFTVAFRLGAAPADGECGLRIELADTHWGHPPTLQIKLNRNARVYSTPPGAPGDDSIAGRPEAGKRHVMDVSWPVSALRQGDNTVTITSIDGSWMLYEKLAFHAPAGAVLEPSAAPRPVLSDASAPPVRDHAGMRLVRVRARHFGEPAPYILRAGTTAREITLRTGEQLVEIPVPDVDAPTPVTLTLERDGETLAEAEALLQPARDWTIYLLHHTHLDIGYTHHQSEVERIQWEHIGRALELIEETKDYPPEARFVWLPEGLWAVDSYLEQAAPAQRDAFFAAVKSGSIGLDALYGNQLTALCRPEELIELTGYARRLAAARDLVIDSAMITDVPGYTWGIVPVLAKSGVKYFSVGPNRTHRIGFTLSQWGDKPFYWVAPSGNERVLTWVHAEGYSWFHGGVSAAPDFHALYEERILGYVQTLQDREDYPFDIAVLRYNIGGDNGPPDEHLPAFIRQWNERYASPRLAFATTTQAFSAFEAKYGGQLPEVRGDFTPYWEDGAASSARETALARAAAERLVQAAAISVLTAAPYDKAAHERAWREVILYNEHTWGAHNSISQPLSDFALQQWATKQAFALEADRQSHALLDAALAPVAAADGTVEQVGLFNTEGWPRTELVVIPADWPRAGDRVERDGAPLPAQRLADGALAFVARDVPALGGVSVRVAAGTPHAEGAARAEGNTVTNGLVSASVDPETGAITDLRLGGGPNLAGDDGFGGLNAYRYVAGRVPDNPLPNGPVTVEVVDAGPVVATLRVTSDAPGCERLTREIRVVDGIPEVYIADTLDKTAVYEQEGVHIAFPFAVPGATIRMDTPFAAVRPDADQLEGACKNYFTVQRWVDVSNEEFGVTWATPDAPLVEVGAITNDPRATGWIERLEPTATLLSYVMNNYWETNYKAAQDGPTVFRYALRPHDGYDPAAAHRFGTAQSRPLAAAPLKRAFGETPNLAPRAPGLVVQAMIPGPKDGAFLLRLYNAGGEPVDVLDALPSLADAGTRVATLDGAPAAPLAAGHTLAPNDFITVLCSPRFVEVARQ